MGQSLYWHVIVICPQQPTSLQDLAANVAALLEHLESGSYSSRKACRSAHIIRDGHSHRFTSDHIQLEDLQLGPKTKSHAGLACNLAVLTELEATRHRP